MFGLNDWRTFALGSAVFAALTAIFGKIGVMGVNSHFATWVRTVVILFFISGMLLFLDFRFESVKTVSSKTWMFLVISGLCTGFSWLCYYRALQLGPASQVAPVDKLSVALAIFFAWIFLGEKISWHLGIGAMLIVSGTLVVLFG